MYSEKVEALEQLRDRLQEEYARVYNPAKVEIGDFTYGFPIVRTYGEDARLKIGKFCSIGQNVQIYLGGNHRTEWLTTYPFNVLLKDQYPGIDSECAASKGDVIIGNDVWIADNVTIMSGVAIGDGAVIANGAVVSRDVLPYEIVGGVPARGLKTRWSAAAVFKLHWWDWPDEKLAEAIPLLMDRRTGELMEFDRKWRAEHDA